MNNIENQELPENNSNNITDTIKTAKEIADIAKNNNENNNFPDELTKMKLPDSFHEKVKITKNTRLDSIILKLDLGEPLSEKYINFIIKNIQDIYDGFLTQIYNRYNDDPNKKDLIKAIEEKYK